MKRLFFLFVLFTLSISVKIFLFGGVLVDDKNPAYKELALQTSKPTRENCNQNWQTTDCPKVAVITSACEDTQCGYEEYYNGDGQEVATGKFFQQLGMAPKHISVQIDNYQQSTNIFTVQGWRNYILLNEADIIYFNGGDQSRHMRCWFNDDNYPNPIFSSIKRRVLNNLVILVTVSAGTAVQAKTIYGGGSPFGILYFSNSVGLAPNTIQDGNGLIDMRNGTDCLQYQQNGGKMLGFGFVDFVVDTHFDARGRLGRLVPVLNQLNATLGVGIDEYAALYYKDGMGTVYGRNGVFVADLSDTVKVKSQYFQIKKVKLHYLSQGDSFNFKNKKMMANKPAISPSMSGFSDSSDIFSKYECTRLLTRLINQHGNENLGKTKIGESYPKAAPVFDLLFYKNSETKGYKSGNTYSAESISVDFSAEIRF